MLRLVVIVILCLFCRLCDFVLFLPATVDIRCGFRFFLFDLFEFRFLFDLSGNYASPLISNSR